MDQVPADDLGVLKARIERANKRSWEAIAVAVIVFIYAVLSQHISGWMDPGICRSDSFLLGGGPEELPQGAWRAGEDGSWLIMHNLHGDTGLSLFVNKDGRSGISAYSIGDGRSLEIAADGNADVLMSIRRKKGGKPALALGLTEDEIPFVALFDKAGNVRLSAKVADDGNATVQILDEKGMVMWQVP